MKVFEVFVRGTCNSYLFKEHKVATQFLNSLIAGNVDAVLMDNEILTEMPNKIEADEVFLDGKVGEFISL